MLARTRIARVLCALGVAAAVGCGGSDFELTNEIGETGPDSTADDTSVSTDTAVTNDTAIDDTAVANDTSAPPDTTVTTDTAMVTDTAVATDTAPVDTGGDSSTPVCVPTPESCNGRDDDCNGTIDDGIPATSCGVGACRSTAAACAACVPGTPASSDTTCDGVDDDCNGVVDDGCIVCDRYVMVGGVGTGTTPATPMASIQAAINALSTGKVCVAAAGLAGTCSTATYTERVNMKEGVSVYGGFKYGATGWTRGDAACVTIIQDSTSGSPLGAGVYFGHSITNATQLDGFTIQGAAVSGTASAAVSMQGGGRVTNNIITGGAGSASYGMQLIAPSSPTLPAPQIMLNSIAGGNANSTIGIRVSNLAPEIRNNRSISGGTGSNNSKGIELSNARGSIVIDNGTIAAGAGSLTAGIELNGDSSNILIARNTIVGGPGTNQARGITANGATPSGRLSILSNTSISAAGAQSWGIDAAVSGVSMLVDGNGRIIGKTTSGGLGTGIRCMQSGTNCVIARNVRIAGFDTTSGGDGRGVYVLAAASATIRKNGAIVGCASGGNVCNGVHLESASPSDVDGNIFEVNRGNWSNAVLTRWTSSVVRNNIVWVNGGAGITLDVRPSTSGAFETVVTSNTLIAPAPTGSTIPNSWLLVVDNETMSGPPNGVFRNNIALCLGSGSNRTAFQEFGNFGDPRVLENNDLFGCSTLYRDQETGALTSLTAINGLADVPIKGNNVSVNPAFASGGYHLPSTSTLINAGTNASCPAFDFDGDPRPARVTCDIGADEVP